MRVSKAAAQIKVLEQALAFAHERERLLRDRIEYLEAAIKFNSARYSEGGSGEYVGNEEAMNRFEGKT